MFMKYNTVARIVLGFAALGTIIPGIVTDLIGLACLAIAVAITLLAKENNRIMNCKLVGFLILCGGNPRMGIPSYCSNTMKNDL